MNARVRSVAGRVALVAFVLVASALVRPVAVYSQQDRSPEAVTLASGDISLSEDTTAVAMDAPGNAVAAWFGSWSGVRLRARNVAGVGPPSATVSGTRSAAPHAPSGLMVLARSGSRVTVGWTPPSEGLSRKCSKVESAPTR